MFGSFSIGHWLIVLLIVALIFGTRKLRDLGSDLGSAIKGFREGLKNGEGKQTVHKRISKVETNNQNKTPLHDSQ